MTDAELLTMLKADLEIIPQNTTRDGYLTNLLGAAKEQMRIRGIALTDSVGDAQLIVGLASFLYRKRAEDNPVLPPYLRLAMDNRLFKQKIGDAE